MDKKYISYASSKIKEVKELKEKYNTNLLIEIDGGVDVHNIKEVAESGAELIVAGSAVFKNGNIKENIFNLKEAAK